MNRNFVRILDGKVQLFLLPACQPSCTFGAGAVSAIIQGDSVIVQCQDGRIEVWKINSSGASIMGPIRTIH